MTQPQLIWIKPGDSFPAHHLAWPSDSELAGFLCAGADLSVTTLKSAYQQGIFPWYAEHQPVLWWSPDPRMVLQVANFKLHPSLRKTIKRFAQDSKCCIRTNSAFEQVMRNCAKQPRHDQAGTWINEDMVQAYTQLHRCGMAHSIEVWVNDCLVGGLYLVNLGKMVFGESMFHHRADASKIALAALVAICRREGAEWIDCQQNTRHLASLGAAPVERARFHQQLARLTPQSAICWNFSPGDWSMILRPVAKPNV